MAVCCALECVLVNVQGMAVVRAPGKQSLSCVQASPFLRLAARARQLSSPSPPPLEYPSRTPPHTHTHTLHTVMVMNKASSWLSAATLGAAALLVAVEEGQAFVLPQSRLLSGARPAMGPRTRGLVQAVQSMPPPTTTSTSSSAEKGPWSPTSWRNYTARQMPVYDDEVSQATGIGERDDGGHME